ncbi:MAG TPA: helix-turn-helix transcriptional regulator [Pseudonocardiaceae bacterium]|nr:helix-turn-helix transcriptional regulator [Pseudonocardiaceae bacterium]
MPKRKPGPTLRAQWLGQQLRALRESAGMTLKQAGDYLQRDGSMVSRFEGAVYPIRRGDVLALLDLYGVSDERTRDGLLQLSEDVWRKGWWDDYTSTVGRRYADMVWLEARAERLRTYAAMLVPGLLQTREYAETLIRNAATADTPEEKIQTGIELRMTRQQLLRGDQPVDFAAVVDESVLHRVIGSPEVLHAQLTALLDAAERPNVEVRVLPLRHGAHAGLDGSFYLYEMPDPYPDVACLDLLDSRLYVEEDVSVDGYRQAYHQLSAAALNSKESAAMIMVAMKEL